MSTPWIFEQLEGPKGERKLLILNGYAAPFGRPRQKPLVKEVLKSRVQTTRYPKRSGAPVRHAFGTGYEPMEMTGRWMTKHLLRNDGKTANDIANEWTDFLNDERSCRISWGNIVSYIGYIEELELSRESEDEIAWRMKILTDDRDDISVHQGAVVPGKSIDVLFDDVKRFNQTVPNLLKPASVNIAPDFLESLDLLASKLHAPFAALDRFRGQVADFKTAAHSVISHFRSVVAEYAQAITFLQSFLLGSPVQLAVLIRSPEADLVWLGFTFYMDIASTSTLANLAEMDRLAELAGRSASGKTVVAREGDTWESLSTRTTGGPEKAAVIRALNGARYGELPTPGETYLSP